MFKTNYVFTLLLALFLVSCATTKESLILSREDQELQNSLDLENFRIRSDYSSKNSQDCSSFKKADYDTAQENKKAKPTVRVRTALQDFEIQEFIASKDTFVFCGYSTKLQIAFCDDARCSRTDFFEKTKDRKIIESWKTQLPLKVCPNVTTTEAQPTQRQEEEPQQMSAMKVAPATEIILDHKYFKVSYNKEHMLPNWVSYRLLASNVRNKVAKRKNKFFADPVLIKMEAPYAKPTDFNGKVYDRGHLAPSEDFVWSQEANNETFVMSNMTPQKIKLNRGAWKSLETKVRKWACTEEELTVISGPILESGLKKFKSKVSIPQKFFKVVIDETAPRKAIAFVLEQNDKKFDMASEATSLAEAEKLAGIDFAKESGLSPAEYKMLRTTFDVGGWIEGDCVRKVARER